MILLSGKEKDELLFGFLHNLCIGIRKKKIIHHASFSLFYKTVFYDNDTEAQCESSKGHFFFKCYF